MTATGTGLEAPARRNAPDQRGARLLAVLGVATAIAAMVAVGVLHALPDTVDISPVRRTISEYALTDSGWLFNLAAVALAFGSLAVLAALVRAGQSSGWSPGSVLGAVWAVALLVVVLFPKHNWAIGPSTNGQIHRVASIVAFLCLPLAVLLLTRRSTLGRSRRRPPPARIARLLAAVSLAWFAPLLGAIVLSPLIRTPWYQAIPLGLVERGLVFSEVLAVIALGIWAFSATKRTRTPPPASPELPSRAG
jgi:hypothetical protein